MKNIFHNPQTCKQAGCCQVDIHQDDMAKPKSGKDEIGAVDILHLTARGTFMQRRNPRLSSLLLRFHCNGAGAHVTARCSFA